MGLHPDISQMWSLRWFMRCMHSEKVNIKQLTQLINSEQSRKSLDGNRKERNFPFSRHHKPYCSHLSDLQGQESFLSCTYTNIRRGDRNDTLDRHFRIVVFFLKMTVQQLLPFLLQCVMMFSLLGASLVRWFIIL